MPDSLAALGKLGVRLPEGGAALRGIRFCGSESSVTGDFPNGTGRGLRRVALHEVLVNRAEQKGIRMMWGIKHLHTRRGRVSFDGGEIETKLIVGADGLQSTVRQEAGLDDFVSEKRRFGFRKHYGLAPWSAYVEIYWGNHFQIYVTPMATDQVCVALISTDPHLRLDAALRELPVLAGRLAGAPEVTAEKGSLSLSRRLRRVWTDGYVLLGDRERIGGCNHGRRDVSGVQTIGGFGGSVRRGQSGFVSEAAPRDCHETFANGGIDAGVGCESNIAKKSSGGFGGASKPFDSLLAAHVGHKPLTDAVSWQLVSFAWGVLGAKRSDWMVSFIFNRQYGMGAADQRGSRPGGKRRSIGHWWGMFIRFMARFI